MRIRWLGMAPLFFLLLFARFSPGLAQQAGAPATTGGQGDQVKAPQFELPGSDGKRYALAQYLGRKPVVLAWFPKAFTGG